MKRKCLIVYHYFAHYRKHIFELLGRSDSWSFELVGDVENEVGINCLSPHGRSDPVEGVEWTVVKNLWVAGDARPLLWQRGLFARLRQDDYDAVIFLGNIYYITTWLCLPYLKTKKKKILFWTHGFIRKERSIISFLRHSMYRSGDGCLLYGEKAKRIMLDSGKYNASRLKVIFNSIEYSTGLLDGNISGNIVAIPFKDPSLKTVIVIGRINSTKRLDLLFSALEVARKKGRPFNVLLVGEGVEVEGLRKLGSELGLEQFVVFHGAAYGSEADDLLKLADLCVIPGDIGLTAVHAMAAGLPVVTHDDFDRQKPEHEAILEGLTGSFYEYGSIESLEEKIHFWLDSRERRDKAAIVCRKTVREKYDGSVQARGIVEILNELYA